MEKKYELCVKIGEYNGKPKYKNVGLVANGQHGMYILLDKTFNPAGVETKPGSNMIILSMFQPRQNNKQGGFGDAPPSDDDEQIPF